MISRDDEEQHPEHLRLDPRGPVGLRRPVVVLLVGVPAACARDRGGFHARPPRSAGVGRRPGLDVLDGLAGRALDAVDELVGHPLRSSPAGSVEIDDLGDVEVLDRVHRRGVGVRVADHAGGHDPGLAQRVEQPREARAGLRRRHRRGAEACGTTTMKRCGPSAASASRRRVELGAGRRLVGEHERDVERQALGRRGRPRRARRAGRSPRGCARAGRAAASPRTSDGQRGDDDLVDPVLGDRVHRGVVGVLVADLAGASRCPRRA